MHKNSDECVCVRERERERERSISKERTDWKI